MSNSQRVAASFRDPSGFLFHREGVLYRQVNRSYQGDYDRMVGSGLYRALVADGFLIPHDDVAIEPAEPETAYKVICPEPLMFLSYPYEWSFSQLKDVALTTLAIQKRALEFGMSLKDCSAYNIQFHHGRPVLIDTLSFETYREGKPWVAYRQFCQHFLAPLALMSYRDVRLGQLLQVHMDGLPLNLASRLLPLRTRLNPGLLLHIHLHVTAQRRYSADAMDKPLLLRKMSRIGFLGLIDSLESCIRKLRWMPVGTEWVDYYAMHDYTPNALAHKKQLVSAFIERIRPRNVWDLGANTGLFSRLVSRRGIPTLAFDLDPGAVEQNYLACVAEQEKNLLPLVLNLVNPSPSIGWRNQERMSFLERGPADTVMALALIHHLAIGNNVPLGRLAEFFGQLGKWLIVEFIPKEDAQVRKMLAFREDIFPDYTPAGFDQAFCDCFVIRAVERIQDSTRSLYLLEKKELVT